MENQVGFDCDSITLIEAEIEALMHRLLETDPDAIYRLEKLLAKIRRQA